MFIDQLEMIHEKTRGNLSSEESEILTRVLSDLQLTFVQAAGNPPAPAAEVPAEVPEAPAAAPAPTPEKPADEPVAADTESRKKFTKSYGS
jgi:hypothetical protein